MFKLQRISQIAVSLIPALLGILGFANNISEYRLTLDQVVTPMLTMHPVRDTISQSWRSIVNPSFISCINIFMIAVELMVGILALIGIIKMLRHLNHTNEKFFHSKTWVLGACILGIMTWGLGFFVFGGEYFLSWQHKNSPTLLAIQSDAVMYVIMMAVPYFILKSNNE